MTWHALVPLPLNKLLVFLTQVKCCANFPCPRFHCVQTSLIKNKELTYWDFLGRASFIHNRFFSTMSLMTEKPGSSADVNWPLQDCAPRSHAALHQLLVAWDIQAGLQGAAGSSCLALPFPSQGTNVFYQSKSPPNASSQATKMPVAQVLTKTRSFPCFCKHKTRISLFHWRSPRAGVPAGSQQLSPEKLLQGPEHLWVQAAIPARAVLRAPAGQEAR